MTPEWHEKRRHYIGASESAMMLGHSPWGGPLELWMRKTNPDYRGESNVAQDIGTALEPVILEWWGRNVGIDMDPNPEQHITHPDEPRMGANLDAWGWVEGPGGIESPATPVVVEAKTADWRDREKVEAWRDGLVQPSGKWAAYWIQVQHQLEVTDMDRGFLAILIDKSFYSIEIERDRSFGAYLRKTIGQWWARHIEGGEMPEANAQDMSALSMIPATEGKTVDRPDLAETIEALRECKALIKATKKQADEHESRLKSAMGDAEEMTFGEDGPKKVTWRTTHRKARTVEYAAVSYRTFRS